MSTETSAKLQALPRLQKSELQALWRELFAKPPHPKLRRELMIPILAYRIQENAWGGLKFSARKRLQRLGEELIRNREAPLQITPELKPGTKLLRQWQGELHEVTVADEGFRCRGQRYESLSEIAREITGTRWSGPAFFGLKKTIKKVAAQ
jgi:hypothetical protein